MVHGSHAYRKMDVTTQHISRILKLREMLLSFHTGLNLVTAAAISRILELECFSGLEPSSVITEPRYWMLVTVSSFYASTLISVLMPRVLLVVSLDYSTLISVGCGGVVKTLG